MRQLSPFIIYICLYVCRLCILHPLVFIIHFHISLSGFDGYTGWEMIILVTHGSIQIFLVFIIFIFNGKNQITLSVLNPWREKENDWSIGNENNRGDFICRVTLYTTKEESKEELFPNPCWFKSVYIYIDISRNFSYPSRFISIVRIFSLSLSFSFSICESVACFYFLVERTQGCNYLLRRRIDSSLTTFCTFVTPNCTLQHFIWIIL